MKVASRYLHFAYSVKTGQITKHDRRSCCDGCKNPAFSVAASLPPLSFALLRAPAREFANIFTRNSPNRSSIAGGREGDIVRKDGAIFALPGRYVIT